jgi:hypothetical protein
MQKYIWERMSGAALRRVWESLPGVIYSAEPTTPPPVDDVPPGYMDSARGSEYLGISKSSFYSLLKRRRVPFKLAGEPLRKMFRIVDLRVLKNEPRRERYN